MTQTCAICIALLRGEVLSIMDGFHKFSCSNLPREISRGIEQKFGLTISKQPMKFVSKYGQAGNYYQYRLNPTLPGNDVAIQKMKEYINEQLTGEKSAPVKRDKPNNDQPKQPLGELIQKELF